LGFGTRPVANTTPIGAGPTYPGYTYGSGAMPKLSQFKSKALVGDALPVNNAFWQTEKGLGHVTKGINVFYQDASVQWVPYSVFKTNYAAGAGTAMLTTSTTPNTGVWIDLDQFH